MAGAHSLAFCCLVIVAATAGAQSTVPTLILAGTDPAGDSHNYVAPSVPADAAVTATRTDIVGLHLAQDADTLTVRLDIGAVPGGTGGYLYHVGFTVGATTYAACWTVQWTGGQNQQENYVGCSRFSGVTLVGPDTRAAGVQVGSDDMGSFVLWPVARSSIAGAGIADLTDVHATTWFRGLSNCCVGSTSQAQYVWNQADRGPDTDFFVIDLSQLQPEVGDLNVTVAADTNNTTVLAGTAAEFTVHVGADNATFPENTTVTLNATGLPAGWRVAWAETMLPSGTGGNQTVGNGTSNGTVDPQGNGPTGPDFSLERGNGTTNITIVMGGEKQNATLLLGVMAPAGLPNGTYDFAVEAFVGNQTNASTLATFSVTVIAVEDATLHEGQNQTATAGGKGIPGVAAPLVVVSMLAALGLGRRRKE